MEAMCMVRERIRWHRILSLSKMFHWTRMLKIFYPLRVETKKRVKVLTEIWPRMMLSNWMTWARRKRQSTNSKQFNSKIPPKAKVKIHSRINRNNNSLRLLHKTKSLIQRRPMTLIYRLLHRVMCSLLHKFKLSLNNNLQNRTRERRKTRESKLISRDNRQHLNSSSSSNSSKTLHRQISHKLRFSLNSKMISQHPLSRTRPRNKTS
jgi:hypothetical protein